MTTQVDPFSVEATKAASFLSGGSGTVAAKFPQVGFTVEGTVLEWRMTQQTDMDSGELLFWEGNKRVKQSLLKFPATARPVDQMVIEIQGEPTGITWETNQYIEKALPEDDGVRALYVKGGLQVAIGKAVKEKGHAVPEVGSYLKITRGKSVKKDGAQFAAHTFTAEYIPAAQNPHKAAEALAGGEGGQGGAPNPFGD